MKKKVLREEKSPKRPVNPLILQVAARPGERTRGFFMLAGRMIPVALGRSGIRHHKREGDGVTPAGRWRPVELRWRNDHGTRPATALPTRQTRRIDGWCDDPASPAYNRPVRLPFKASHEEMWRADALYDLVVVLDHNSRPRKARGGSAVFLHLARQGFEPTAGCIAFRRGDFRAVLSRLSRRSVIRVG